MSERCLASKLSVYVVLSDVQTGAVLPGLGRVAVSNVQIDFPLDGLATANFTLATGINAATGRLAEIAKSNETFQTQFKVEAYLEITGKESPRRAWPRTKFRIWDGLSTGVGYTRSRGNIAITIQAVHWLYELEQATTASSDILRNSVTNLNVSFGLETIKGFQPTNTAGLLSQVKIPGDLWKDGIWNLLSGLMGGNSAVGGSPQVWYSTVVAGLNTCKLPGEKGTVADPAYGNKRAVSLVNSRFVFNPDKSKTLLPGNLYFPWPVYDTALSRFIVSAVTDRVGMASPLEKIRTLTDSLMFKLVHNVEHAGLVPSVPVMHSSHVWRTIYPDEYRAVRVTGFTPKQLQGVGLVSSSIVNETTGNPQMSGQLAGAFRRPVTGAFYLAAAPFWLRFVSPAQNLSSQSTTLRTLKTGSTAAGDKGKFKTAADDAALDKAQAELGCNLARLVFFEQAYKNRTMMISGRLRFDIAPGSNVRLMTFGPTAPQITTQSQGSFGSLYGCVTRVSVVIDCDDPAAYTTFELSHIRSEEEKDLANTEHPVYPKSPWYGSPLVKLAEEDMVASK